MNPHCLSLSRKKPFFFPLSTTYVHSLFPTYVRCNLAAHEKRSFLEKIIVIDNLVIGEVEGRNDDDFVFDVGGLGALR